VSTQTRLPVGQWVRHSQFGVGQVVERTAHTHRNFTQVFFPVRPENPNGKPTKRRVLTESLKPIEKPA
jgi:hypothetical protein